MCETMGARLATAQIQASSLLLRRNIQSARGRSHPRSVDTRTNSFGSPNPLKLQNGDDTEFGSPEMMH